MIIDLRKFKREIKIKLEAEGKDIPFLDLYIDKFLKDLEKVLIQRKEKHKIKIKITII